MTSKIQLCDAGIIRVFKMHYHRRFYGKLLEGYELGQTNLEKINVLDAINLAVSARSTNVEPKTIANCFRHCKIRSVEEISSKDLHKTLYEEGIHELQTIINNLGFRNGMYVNYLLDYPNENNENLDVQSLEEIVANITEDHAEDEVEDDIVPLEPISRTEALKSSTTLHNFLLHYENSTS